MGSTVSMTATIYDKIKHVITSNDKRMFIQINAFLPTEEPEVVLGGGWPSVVGSKITSSGALSPAGGLDTRSSLLATRHATNHNGIYSG